MLEFRRLGFFALDLDGYLLQPISTSEVTPGGMEHHKCNLLSISAKHPLEFHV